MAQQGTNESGPRPVASVARALALLEELRDSEHGLGVNELARRIGVNASTASRLLATLESFGVVQRDGQGPYRLGLALVRQIAEKHRGEVQYVAREGSGACFQVMLPSA